MKKKLDEAALLSAYAVGGRWINRKKGYPAWQEDRLDRDYFKAWKMSVRAVMRRLGLKIKVG